MELYIYLFEKNYWGHFWAILFYLILFYLFMFSNTMTLFEFVLFILLYFFSFTSYLFMSETALLISVTYWIIWIYTIHLYIRKRVLFFLIITDVVVPAWDVTIMWNISQVKQKPKTTETLMHFTWFFVALSVRKPK